MSVRAKFKCESITWMENGAQVKLRAVADGGEENKQFFKYTPSATIDMSIVNDVAAVQFKPGASYYVDFTNTADT